MKKLLMITSMTLVLGAGCSKNKVEESPVQAVENTATEVDPLTQFVGNLTAEAATTGGEGLKLTGSDVGGLFEMCGLKDGDIVLEANAAPVTLDVAGAKAVKQACLDKGAFKVERNGVVVSTAEGTTAAAE